ncbi:MAG: hypothetical protein IJ608_08365 [Lachnospiraceae bacterium]|nr:hypothetical protein [Lachnospiraceae bacterium]
MERRLDIFRNFIVIEANHIALLPLCIMLYDIVRLPDYRLKGFYLSFVLLSLVPFLFMLIRIFLSRFLLFLGGHIAVSLLSIFLISSFGLSKLFYALIVFYFIYSFIVRLNVHNFADVRMAIPVAVTISLTAIIMLHYMGNLSMDISIIICLIINLSLLRIVDFIDGYLDFLFLNSDSLKSIPYKEIYRLGMHIVLLFTGLYFILLMIFSGQSTLLHIIYAIKDGFIYILRLLFGLLDMEAPEAVDTEEYSIPGMSEQFFPEQTEPSLFWQILDYIAYVLVLLFILSVIVFGIIRLLRFIRERMNTGYIPERRESSHDYRDKREHIDNVESIKIKNLGKAIKENLSPDMRIRKAYKRYVEKKKLERPNYTTAQEYGEALEIESFGELYDKARYSKENCTSAEYMKFRTITNEK